MQTCAPPPPRLAALLPFIGPLGTPTTMCTYLLTPPPPAPPSPETFQQPTITFGGSLGQEGIFTMLLAPRHAAPTFLYTTTVREGDSTYMNCPRLQNVAVGSSSVAAGCEGGGGGRGDRLGGR